MDDLLMKFHVQEGHIQLICQISQLLSDVLAEINFFLFDGLGDSRG